MLISGSKNSQSAALFFSAFVSRISTSRSLSSFINPRRMLLCQDLVPLFCSPRLFMCFGDLDSLSSHIGDLAEYNPDGDQKSLVVIGGLWTKWHTSLDRLHLTDRKIRVTVR